MVGRRQFLVVTSSAIGAGIAWPWGAQAAWRVAPVPSVLPSSPLRAAAHAELKDGQPAPALMIFDPAFALACAVASAARRTGQSTLELEGDVGTFWYRSILPLLQPTGAPERRLTLTGITPHATFFVLSTLATVAGMSVSSRPMMSAEGSSIVLGHGHGHGHGRAKFAAMPLAATGSEVRSAFPDRPSLAPFATIGDDDRHLVAWHFEFRQELP
jgi:hypothetical protein